MNLDKYLVTTKNVYKAKHGKEFIYVGNDVNPEMWLVYFKGEDKNLDCVRTLDEAKAEAHSLFHNKKKCTKQLQWELLPETKTSIVELGGWPRSLAVGDRGEMDASARESTPRKHPRDQFSGRSWIVAKPEIELFSVSVRFRSRRTGSAFPSSGPP